MSGGRSADIEGRKAIFLYVVMVDSEKKIFKNEIADFGEQNPKIRSTCKSRWNREREGE